MNQKRYRLIFSKRSGMLVPVAEDRAAQMVIRSQEAIFS
ncbi:ESPR-type extended signal peptide-containing protein [Xylophilus sp. GOD-11R]|nr:ESPR-type extended signal peptide-containing protein [Xylophilus sp. GOD-11R]WPB57984.1 ESPR-type extended signal peptide-containing protein [Xylophilus sp. GOD-11R]